MRLTIKNVVSIGNGGPGLRMNGVHCLYVSCPKCGSQDVKMEDVAIVNNVPLRGKITCKKCGHSEDGKITP